MPADARELHSRSHTFDSRHTGSGMPYSFAGVRGEEPDCGTRIPAGCRPALSAGGVLFASETGRTMSLAANCVARGLCASRHLGTPADRTQCRIIGVRRRMRNRLRSIVRPLDSRSHRHLPPPNSTTTCGNRGPTPAGILVAQSGSSAFEHPRKLYACRSPCASNQKCVIVGEALERRGHEHVPIACDTIRGSCRRGPWPIRFHRDVGANVTTSRVFTTATGTSGGDRR